MRRRTKQLKYIAWGQAAAVTVLAVLVWGSLYDWQVLPLSNYQLFPLFGLLAFSLMWAHYIVAVLRNYWQLDSKVTKGYFELTSFGVLLALLLHPSLFIGQLYADGFGLPPGSYEAYVPTMTWVVLLGTVSLGVFLLFELRRFFGDRSWWKYVSYLSDVAMLAIFYHGVTLGSHLQSGWFRGVWFFYGFTLLLALVYLRLFAKPETVKRVNHDVKPT